jgi:uncharacterized domain 1
MMENKDTSASSVMFQRVSESFDKQALMKTIGASLVDVREGSVSIKCMFLDETRQQHGFAHAAVAFAIGDSAAGYSALTMMEPGHEVLTSEMKINLLSPAIGDYLMATGEVVKAGRKLIIVRATVVAVTDGQEKDVAILQGTMVQVTM